MKNLIGILLFVVMILIVFNCKKDVEHGELAEVVLTQKQTSLQRGSLGFNGATSFEDSIDAFETTFNKGGDCEVYGQYARMQGGTRKSNKVIFFLDYDIGMNVSPVGDGTATMYSVNVFRWYRYNGSIWRISINGDDIAEFTLTEASTQAIVGINLCGGTLKKVTYQPAFKFLINGNWRNANNISPYGGARGVVRIDLATNNVQITER